MLYYRREDLSDLVAPPLVPALLNEYAKRNGVGIPGSKLRLAKANDFNVGHLTTNAGNIAIKTLRTGREKISSFWPARFSAG